MLIFREIWASVLQKNEIKNLAIQPDTHMSRHSQDQDNAKPTAFLKESSLCTIVHTPQHKADMKS